MLVTLDGICTLNGTNTNWLLLKHLNSNRYTDNECSNNAIIHKHLTSITGSLKNCKSLEKKRCYLWRLLDSHRSVCNTLKQQEYLLTVLWLAYKFFSARNIHLSDVWLAASFIHTPASLHSLESLQKKFALKTHFICQATNGTWSLRQPVDEHFCRFIKHFQLRGLAFQLLS